MGNGCTTVKEDSMHFARRNENYKNKLNPTEPVSKWESKMLRDVDIDPLAVIRDFPRMLVYVNKLETTNSQENINGSKKNLENSIRESKKSNSNNNNNNNNEKIISIISVERNNEALTVNCNRTVTNPLKKLSNANYANRPFNEQNSTFKRQSNDKNISRPCNNIVNIRNPLVKENKVNNASAEIINSITDNNNNSDSSSSGNNSVSRDKNSCNQNNNNINTNAEKQSTTPLLAVNSANFLKTNVNYENENILSSTNMTSRNDSSKINCKLNEWRRLQNSMLASPQTETCKKYQNTLWDSADNTYHINKNTENINLSNSSFANTNSDNSISNNSKIRNINRLTLLHKEPNVSPWLTKGYNGNGNGDKAVNVQQKRKWSKVRKIAIAEKEEVKLAEHAQRVKETVLELAELCNESADVIALFRSSWDSESNINNIQHRQPLSAISVSSSPLSQQSSCKSNRMTSVPTSGKLREERPWYSMQDIYQQFLDACTHCGMIKLVECTEYDVSREMNNNKNNNREERKAHSNSDSKLLMKRSANSLLYRKSTKVLQQSQDDLYLYQKEKEESSEEKKETNEFRLATSAPIFPFHLQSNARYRTGFNYIHNSCIRKWDCDLYLQRANALDECNRITDNPATHFYSVRSATFHLMQFMTQNTIFFPLQRLKHILWMPWAGNWQDVSWIVNVFQEKIEKKELNRQHRMRWLRNLPLQPALTKNYNLCKEIYNELNVNNATDDDDKNSTESASKYLATSGIIHKNNNTKSENNYSDDVIEDNKKINWHDGKICERDLHQSTSENNTNNLITLLKMRSTNTTISNHNDDHNDDDDDNINNAEMATVIVIEHVQTIRHYVSRHDRSSVPYYEIEWKCRIRVDAAALRAAFHSVVQNTKTTNSEEVQVHKVHKKQKENTLTTKNEITDKNDDDKDKCQSSVAEKENKSNMHNEEIENDTTNNKNDDLPDNCKPLIELIPIPPEITKNAITSKAEELFDKTIYESNKSDDSHESFPTFKPISVCREVLNEQKRLENIINSEILNCDISISKASIERVKRHGLWSSSSHVLWKKRASELTYILRSQYHVEPVYVTKLKKVSTYM